MRSRPRGVKQSSRSGETVPFLLRWLEGWGVIFPSVGIAALAAWLALPQGTMPDYLPLPRLSAAELSSSQRDLAQAGAIARVQPLAYEVRAVGESVRQLGRFSHDGDSISVSQRERLRELVRSARAKAGDRALVALRAVQTQLFQVALRQWEATGVESEELIELGGDFLAFAKAHDWLEGVPSCGTSPTPKDWSCRLRLDEVERAALFLSRWTELCAPGERALELEPVWRLVALRARLRLPITRLRVRDLALIERVSALDPNYPELLGKGLVYLGLHDFEHASEALRSQLRLHPDGPYALRARNHLVYAAELMNGDGT